MPSPCPGMDPYVERYWLDLHLDLTSKSRRAIQRQLGDDLVARVEERLIVEAPDARTRRIGPDVRVVEHGRPGNPVSPQDGLAVAEPLVLRFAGRAIE